MAWTPISGTMTQYHTSANLLAANYYLKFYQSGTTTAFNMATDSTGGTTLDKCQLDSSGYPTTDGTTRFIPHVDQTYKIVLYQNATDADNNTTGSADWVIDAIAPPVSSSVISLNTTNELKLGSEASGQVFTLTTPYVVGSGNLKVFRNGILFRVGAGNDYVETSTTQVTINSSISIVATDNWTFNITSLSS